jgi:hypothetical protein
MPIGKLLNFRRLTFQTNQMKMWLIQLSVLIIFPIDATDNWPLNIAAPQLLS